jgi:hypothetical protein
LFIWKAANGNFLLFGKRQTATFYYLESGEQQLFIIWKAVNSNSLLFGKR